jgi:hypothetical protein
MNLTMTWLPLSAAALLWAAPSQQQGLRPAEEPLAPLQDAAPEAFDAASVAAALRSGDLAERTRAYEAALDAALRDPAALEAVRAWAGGGAADIELAWTAKLLLRELARTPAPRTSPHGLNPDPWDTSWLDGFFGGDPFEDLRPLLKGPTGGWVPPFGGWSGGGSPFLTGPDTGRGESLRVESGPDGVRVEVEETRDGTSETKVHEAGSMEELLEAHPELRGRLGAGGERALAPLGGLPWLEGLLEGRRPSAGGALRPVRPSLDVLGVRMIEPGRRVTTYPGAAADEGLEVVDVLPGTLAAAIGVRPGDLVRRIAGETIRDAADVRRVLAGLSLAERIDVECLRPDGEVCVRSWIPEGDARQDGEPGAAPVF